MKTPEPTPSRCPDCGAEIPPGQPKGLCFTCALKGALEATPLLASSPVNAQSTAGVIEQPGERIGRYKLLEKIGEGGCGVVYMAEQEEPVRRRVALKVIKPGMDTHEVIARFEAERQALALMEHPHIAKVFDGGATDAGRPYFVMELVRGLRITDYCDQENLSTWQRLDLFMQVCQAVQHAHQKGIIHRDIKPSNVLVTVNDGVSVPKVIDFGIAKATGQALTDKTFFTRFQQLIGTPAYMSPEQTEMTSVDIDTRSDVYSLGVLLYELLTGRTPFDAGELLRAGMEEMLHTIREQEPARPSARLNTLAAVEQTTVAQQRQTDGPKLINLVRGDLDWIVMKCLEKDRTRRYETANGLVADIKRHLDNEPVVARPPGTMYRFEKMVRRNKVTVAAAVSIVMVLLIGGMVSAWQAVRATRAEREQSLMRMDAEKGQQREASLRREAETAKRTAEDGQRKVLELLYASDRFLAERALTESNLVHADAILRGLEESIERKPDAPELRRAHGAVLQRAGKLDEAYEAFSKAIGMAATNNDKSLFRDTLLRRSQLLRQLNRVAEAGMDERRASGFPSEVFSSAVLPDFHQAPEVRVDFGATNRQLGLYVVEEADSKHTLGTRDGIEAWFFRPGYNYCYFLIDPTFKNTLASKAIVKVEYQVVRGNPLGLQYDDGRSAYALASKSAPTKGSNGWNVIEFRLYNAHFQSSQNSGADFRLYDNENGFFLKSVAVSRYEKSQLLIPPRDPSTSSNLIDLTAYYNSNSKHYAPQGDIARMIDALDMVRQKTGVNFDWRGHIALHRQQEELDGRSSPSAISIPIGRHLNRLHFLHGASYREFDGRQIGSYSVQMSDGSHADIPIVYGKNIRAERGDLESVQEAEVAWEGEGPRTGGGTRVRIYAITWENPQPGIAVTNIRFTSTGSKSAPHLLAITAE